MIKAFSGFLLVLSVGISVVFAAISIISSFWTGGWSVAICAWLLINAHIGWRGLADGIGKVGARHNGEIALSMTVLTNLYIGAHLWFDPPTYSSWWGFFVPVVILIESIILIAAYETILNLFHKDGLRENQ